MTLVEVLNSFVHYFFAHFVLFFTTVLEKVIFISEKERVLFPSI